MTDNETTDNSATGTETSLSSSRHLTSDLCPPVYYAGCLDSDPYFCLKQCDCVVVSELRSRGVNVRELHKELPKGKIFRKLNRKILYPALVAKATPAPSAQHPASILHIGSQCYANLIPVAQRLAPGSRHPVSITVHDVAEHYFPQDLTAAQMRRWKKRTVLLKKADLIFSVSRHTKSDLINIFGIPADRIIVNPNGIDPAFRPVEKSEISGKLRNSLGSPGGAFLHGTGGFNVLAVGANLYRKNLPTLLDAVKGLADRGVPVTLIKAGDPLPPRLVPSAQRLEIINLGHVSKAELISLYNLCDVLAFPSLYEGFGMPVVEAQRCGLPCVISNAASLLEIGGDGALYHDPLDVEGLSDQLQQVYEDQNLRNELREKGLKNAEHFSWERHVDALLKGWGAFLQPVNRSCVTIFEYKNYLSLRFQH